VAAFLRDVLLLLTLPVLGAVAYRRVARHPRMRHWRAPAPVRRLEGWLWAGGAVTMLGMLGMLAVTHGVVSRALLRPSGLLFLLGLGALVATLVRRILATMGDRSRRAR
jgi:hypothetical protein